MAGKLTIFFSYATGAGKTYAMIEESQKQLNRGIDVLIGYIEPHTCSETVQLLKGIPTLPPKLVEHNHLQFKEFDLDAALSRKPELIIVDELAHSNWEGVRNKKRYQDIEELLNAGINVYTSVNVQNLESLNDIVQTTMKVSVQETIPDSIFEHADKVKLIDLEPEDLIRRYQEEKIFGLEKANKDKESFFIKENLYFLREISMRKMADWVSRGNQEERYFSEKKASLKLLVCVSPSPSSAKCIRWTARTAEAFHAPWIAVYVETKESELITESEKKNLRANMELAERLGGEIITLNGFEIAPVVAEYARLSCITNIVVGKSRNKTFFKNLFEIELEDKLLSLLPRIEIHIIPGNTRPKTYREPKRLRIRENLFLSWADLLKTIAILSAATLLSIGFDAFHIGEQTVIMVELLSILIISRVTMGYVYGILASAISVLAYNYFFTAPYFSFYATDYPITFVIMLIVALFTSTLTVRIKTQARLAVEKERRTEILYEINKKFLVTRGLENIVTLTNEYMIKLFGRSAIFYTQDPLTTNSGGVLMQAPEDLESSFMQLESEHEVVHWVFINQKNAGVGTDTHRTAKAFYVPILSQGKVLGVIGLSCSKGKLSQNNRSFLRMIISLAAMALERQYLSDEQRRILIESEKEKMRSNLLRAISHDLRTPLTSILGASSAILEHGDSLAKSDQEKLLTNIKDDSQWLIRMVENLLSVTRIKEGTMNVTKTPEAAEEIVAEAVSRIRKRFSTRKISVKAPEVLLMVPMDGTLIEQVLINLIENALKHSPKDSIINVKVKKDGDYARFEVIDHGEGIAEEDFPYLFESYVPNGKRSSDSSRGMGIGLSICMSIVKAHQGKMEAYNKESGGAVFQFILPLKGSENDE